MNTQQDFEIQPLAWVVKPKGAELFADATTRITREDEAAGQFLLISQRSEAGQIAISPEEWPAIRQAIEAAFDAILADELHEFAPPVDPPPTAPPSAPPQAEPTGAELVGKRCWVRHDLSPHWRERVVQKYAPSETYCYGTHPEHPAFVTDSLVWWSEAKPYVEGVAP